MLFAVEGESTGPKMMGKFVARYPKGKLETLGN